jgi:hypothetical protein
MMDFEASNHACAEIYFAVKPQQRAQTRKPGSLNLPLANRTSFFWGKHEFHIPQTGEGSSLHPSCEALE